MAASHLFDLHGKTALVTGCSRGIGEAMAVALAQVGCDVIGVSGSLEAGSSAEKQIVETGRKFYPYKINLSEREDTYRGIEEIKKNHSRVDILINNAGIIRRAPAVEHSDKDWDEVLTINLDAPFILAREFGKEMVKRGSGKILFTCSLLSFQGGITVPGYAASKGAVASLVRGLANEWAKSGVNVNGIAPGYIATDNTHALRENPERNKAILERIPAGRWGTPKDFIGPTIFLCSSASDYVHGEILTVDGGWMGR